MGNSARVMAHAEAVTQTLERSIQPRQPQLQPGLFGHRNAAGDDPRRCSNVPEEEQKGVTFTFLPPHNSCVRVTAS